MNIRIEVGSLNKQQVTGVGYYTLGLVNALKTLKDVHVDTFLLGTRDKENDSIDHLKKLSVHRVPLNEKIYRKLHQFGLAPVFDGKMLPADITIFPDFAAWPMRRSKLCAVVIHDLTFIKHPEYMRARKFLGVRLPVTTWYLSNVVRHAAKKADIIITVSYSIKEDISSLLGVDPEKIIVTPIPASNIFLNPAKHGMSKKNLCQKYTISTPDYILSVGTIEPRKNQLATLRAYLQLPLQDRSRYSLVFAGSYGWDCNIFLDEFKKAKEAGENLILTGYFDFKDSYSLYHHASLFTSASHYEGFGMPLMEAMAAGTPLIVADIPVFHEVAEDAAIYVAVNKPKDYARNIETLLHNPSRRQYLINQGYRRKNIYSWQQNATLLTKYIYQSLNKH